MIISAPAITPSNETTYVVSGNCSDTGQIVTVTVSGSVTDTPTCTGSAFTTGNMNVSCLADGTSLSVTADHQTANDSTTVVKDTTAPTISSVTTTATGNLITGNALQYTVNFSESVDVTLGLEVSATIGATAQAAVCTTVTGGTSVTCTYTIQAGDVDSDGIATSNTLTQGAATVTDAYGNTMSNFAFPFLDTSGVFANAAAAVIWRPFGGGAEITVDDWGGPMTIGDQVIYEVYNTSPIATTDLAVSRQGAARFDIMANTCGTVLNGQTACEVTIEFTSCQGPCNGGAVSTNFRAIQGGITKTLGVSGTEP